MVGCVEVASGLVVQAVHGGPVRPGDEVAIEVNGDLDRVVAELVSDVGEGLPLSERLSPEARQAIAANAARAKWARRAGARPAED
jgi:hypothetical protein